LQAAGRDVEYGEAPPGDESNLLLSALRSTVQELACLIVTAESHQRLCGANGCAASKVEISASSGAPEAFKRSLCITSIKRIGARINQAAGVIVADRPTGAQEFVEFHLVSVCDRLGLRRPTLIGGEESCKDCVKFGALRAGARQEEWRRNLTQRSGGSSRTARNLRHLSALKVGIAYDDQVRTAVGGLLGHALKQCDALRINQEYGREAGQISEPQLRVATIKRNPTGSCTNGGGECGVAQQGNVPNAIPCKREGQLLTHSIRSDSANHLNPLAATHEQTCNAHAEPTCMMRSVSSLLCDRTTNDCNHL
jgi:hypothetical protein